MSFKDLASSRKSSRRYKKNVSIPRKDLELCVECARHAPSACNSQPWNFIIVDDRSKLSRIYDEVISGIYAINSFASDCPAFIAVVSEKARIPARVGGKLMGTDFRFIDAGIACAHIILQAEELGIGTCVLGWFNDRRLKKILSVPASGKIKLLIALGYSEENVQRKKPLKDREQTVSFNTYGSDRQESSAGRR